MGDALYWVCEGVARWSFDTTWFGAIAPKVPASNVFRSIRWATAWRRVTRFVSAERRLKSSSRKSSEGRTVLCVFGNPVTAPIVARSKLVTWTTDSLLNAIVPSHVEGDAPTDTVTFFNTAVVPHHRGFRASTAVSPLTDWRIIGPAESSTEGSKWAKPVFQPTRLATCAGTM